MTAVTWSNWAGNQSATGLDIRHPRGTAEIAAIVREAAAAGRGVRPIGSGHSFTAIGAPRDIQLVLDRHNGLISIDMERHRVTVQSGMTLHQLNRLLEHAGLAMSNLGDIEKQTISGALATGTHGTGHRHGGLATQLRGLEFVTADGSVIACSPDLEPELFELARVNLGALGVMSAVTLQVEPAYAIRASEGGADLSEVLSRFDEWADGTDHFEFYWFPHTTRCLTKHNTRLTLDEAVGSGHAPLTKRQVWWEDEFLSNTLFGGVVGAGRRVPRLVAPMAKVAARALSDRTYTDLSYKIFVSDRRVRFEEMEYAVPRAAIVDVVRELVATTARHDWKLSFPVEVRVAPADDIPMSTAYERDSGYLAVHIPAGDPVGREYFAAVESIVAEVAGRPHWGKLHTLGAADLRERYPRFDEFVAARDRLDPTGMFSNGYLDRVLGRAPQAG